jgi:hypothetical protein
MQRDIDIWQTEAGWIALEVLAELAGLEIKAISEAAQERARLRKQTEQD